MDTKVDQKSVDHRKFLIGILLFVLFAIILKNAWISDDGYITFRTVDNFINGYGLRWNTYERVQAYTHPLWMFLVSGLAAITRDVYYTSIFLSIALSLAAAAVICLKISMTVYSSILAVVVLLFSKSFIDYSTSGLENPLSFFLISLFCLVFLSEKKKRNSLCLLTLVYALALLNRIDLGLILLPMLTYAFLQPENGGWWFKIKQVAIGLIPFIAWELFSLLYYGFAVPNTAFAKLGTGIASADYMKQGMLYLFNSLYVDPITLTVIIGALLSSWYFRNPKTLCLNLGILLYILYIVRIGGDFMSGRFLAVPFFLAVISWTQVALDEVVLKYSIALLVIVGLSLSTTSPLNTNYNDTGAFSMHGITDERRVYMPATGLLRQGRASTPPENRMATLGREIGQNPKKTITVEGSIGYYGYFAGPKAAVIDYLALSDPLLSKLPMKLEKDEDWRIGHFKREIPCGYAESIATGQNKICDPDLATYYDRLTLATQGPLFSVRRLRAIIGLNIGHYQPYLDRYNAKSS